MQPEFPYRGRYSVKVFLEVPMIWRGVDVGITCGWALGHEDDGQLHEVVICDHNLCDDETKWIAVAIEETGPLALQAKALWLAAQVPEIQHALDLKWIDYEWDRLETAAEFAAEQRREDRLLAAE